MLIDGMMRIGWEKEYNVLSGGLMIPSLRSAGYPNLSFQFRLVFDILLLYSLGSQTA